MRIVQTRDWQYRWMVDEPEPPNRKILAVWCVLLGMCLAAWVFAGLLVMTLL